MIDAVSAIVAFMVLVSFVCIMIVLIIEFMDIGGD